MNNNKFFDNMNQKEKLGPDFIGIGEAKCASSWIAKCIVEHPQIFIPSFILNKKKYNNKKGFPGKELNWFKDNIFAFKCDKFNKKINSPSWFDKKGIKPYIDFFKKAKEKQIKGEISTTYMYDISVAQKIKKEFPNIKILVYLRNPTERAYSHFYFNKYTIKVDRSQNFEEALKKYSSIYIDTSLYYRQLKPYFDLFPRKNILVVIYEDIQKNPLKFIQNIYQFLGVKNSFIPPSFNIKINPTSKYIYPALFKIYFLGKKILRKAGVGFLINFLKKTKTRNLIKDSVEAKQVVGRPPIKKETRKYLQGVFGEDIKNLEKLIERDLSFWDIYKNK